MKISQETLTEGAHYETWDGERRGGAEGKKKRKEKKASPLIKMGQSMNVEWSLLTLRWSEAPLMRLTSTPPSSAQSNFSVKKGGKISPSRMDSPAR